MIYSCVAMRPNHTFHPAPHLTMLPPPLVPLLPLLCAQLVVWVPAVIVWPVAAYFSWYATVYFELTATKIVFATGSYFRIDHEARTPHARPCLCHCFLACNNGRFAYIKETWRKGGRGSSARLACSSF